MYLESAYCWLLMHYIIKYMGRTTCTVCLINTVSLQLNYLSVFAKSCLWGCIKKLTCVSACVSKLKRRFPPLFPFCSPSPPPPALLLLPSSSSHWLPPCHPCTLLAPALLLVSPDLALLFWPALTMHSSLLWPETFTFLPWSPLLTPAVAHK